jgi:hypothetical protein
MTPNVPLPSGMPATGSCRSRRYDCCLQWPKPPIPARAQPRHDMIHCAREAIVACRLVRKDECKGMKVAHAIQRASPAHRILSITA